MSGTRRRVDCPVCQRSVALNPSGTIHKHKAPLEIRTSWWCIGSTRLTAEDVVRAEIAQLAALISRYPKEARNFVAWL